MPKGPKTMPKLVLIKVPTVSKHGSGNEKRNFHSLSFSFRYCLVLSLTNFLFILS